MKTLHALLLLLAACSDEPQPIGGGYRSIGHGEPMAPPERIRGVYIAGFEEDSFLPGETRMPNAADPRRYRVTIELDDRVLGAMTGQGYSPRDYKAYALTLVARRTRDPFIDCLGGQHYIYVADRIETVRYLGIMPNAFPMPEATTGFVRSGEGGRIRELEDQAIRLCARR